MGVFWLGARTHTHTDTHTHTHTHAHTHAHTHISGTYLGLRFLFFS